MASIIQDDTGTDPLSRKTFAFDEDNWASEHNTNWEKTVSQLNELQRALLGNATESGLDGYSSDDFDTRVSELKSALFGSNDPEEYSDSDHINKRLSDAETLLGKKSHLNRVEHLMEKNAVGKLSSSAGSTDTSLSIAGGTNAALEEGDGLVLVDTSADLNSSGEVPSGAVETATVSSDIGEDTSSVAIKNQLGSDLPAGTLVLLDLASLRRASNLDKIQKILVGGRDPSGISITEGETDHHSRLNEVESSVNSVQSDLSTLHSTVNGNADRITDFEGTLTSVQADVNSATLSAQTFNTADAPFAELDAEIDDTAVTNFKVSWKSGESLPTELSKGELIVLEQEGDREPKVFTVAQDVDDTGSTIYVENSSNEKINAASGAGVYIATSTVASRVSARTDGHVVLDGDIVRSEEFDGSVVESDGSGSQTGGLYYFKEITPDNGEPYKDTGGKGWALTSGGEAAFTNMFLRGYVEISNRNTESEERESKLLGNMRVLEDENGDRGKLISTDGKFWLGPNGPIAAVDGSTAGSSSSSSYSIYQTDQGGVLGDLSAAAASSSSSTVHLKAYELGSQETSLSITSVGDLNINAAGGQNADGILNLSANRAMDISSPTTVFKTLPEAADADKLVDDVIHNSNRANHFGSPNSESTLAQRMTGMLWVDTGQGRRVRSFHPSQYSGTENPASPSVDRENFQSSVVDESTAGEVKVEFTQDVAVSNATIDTYSWQESDGTDFGSGSTTQYTFKAIDRDGEDLGDEVTIDVTLTADYTGDDGSSGSATVNETVTFTYPTADEEDPGGGGGGDGTIGIK